MQLETQRLVLREWQAGDLEDLYAYAKDPQVGPIAGWRPHACQAESRALLEFYLRDPAAWAIEKKETREVIGHIRLTPNENKGKYYAKQLSYALAPAYWGKGYMPEAVQQIVRYAFESMGVEVLTAFHYPHNHRSARVLEKCGFELEGVIPGGSERYDGCRFDAVCYCIFREDYFKEAERKKQV